MRNVRLAPEDRVPLEDIELFDPERFRSGSQQPAWHTLRADQPLWRQADRDGTEFWSVTRYADVLRVIKDPATFSSEYGTILAVLGGDGAGGRTINLMDPPRHAGIRVPTMRLLSTPAVHCVAPTVRGRVRTLVGQLLDGSQPDVMPVLMQLPMAVVGDIIGVPEDCWPAVTRSAMTGVAPDDPAYSTGSTEATLRAAHFELFAMFHDLVRERRAAPREDVISRLLTARVDDRPLTFDEVVLNCYSFVMGANTTTPHAGAQLLLALAEDPRQWQLLRDRPDLVPAAVEEGLRWSTPTNHLVRRLTRPAMVAGTRLEEGALLCAWVASANRDDAVFDRPYEFDLSRVPNPHLGFGNGVHYCNGAPAARLVLRTLLAELLPMVDRLEPAGPPEHLLSNFINGITRLPLRLGPVPS